MAMTENVAQLGKQLEWDNQYKPIGVCMMQPHHWRGPQSEDLISTHNDCNQERTINEVRAATPFTL